VVVGFTDHTDVEVLVIARPEALDAPVEGSGVAIHGDDCGNRRARGTWRRLLAPGREQKEETGQRDDPGEHETGHDGLEEHHDQDENGEFEPEREQVVALEEPGHDDARPDD